MILKNAVISGASGRPISIDLTSKENGAPLVIFVHGFKGFKDWGAHNAVAAYFAEHGFRFLKFNFSHNGTTPGQPEDFCDLSAFGDNTFTKELYDLQQVIDYAFSGKEFEAPESVCLIGHSRGGAIGIIQAFEDKRVKKLATWASVSRFNNMWDEDKEDEWRRLGLIYTENARTKQQMPLNIGLLNDLDENRERLDILAAASKLEKPWLIVHGDADSGVAVTQAYELKEGSPSAEVLIVAGGNHVFGASHPYAGTALPEQLKQVANQTIAFLKEPV